MPDLVDLRNLIGSGSCYAFIGAGASCDAGLRSWSGLARAVYDELIRTGNDIDANSYEKYLRDGKYPELFEVAARDVGGLEELLRIAKACAGTPRETRRVYDYLASWPFAAYITTNFDDLLIDSLRTQGAHHEVLSNTETDLGQINAQTKQVVVRLHGSYDEPEDIVLTSSQYEDFRSHSRRKYFRQRLAGIFQMFPVVMIGYSIRDPDIEFILAQAKHTAAADHPVYAILADLTQAEIDELYARRNVRVIPYNTVDGQHTQLTHHLLPLIDRYVPRRTRSGQRLPCVQEVSPELKASVYIFTETRLRAPDEEFATSIYSSLILSALHRLNRRSDSYDSLMAGLPGDLARHSRSPDLLCRSAEGLRALGLVAGTPSEGSLELTPAGRAQVESSVAQGSLLHRQVSGQIELDHQRAFPSAPAASTRQFASGVLRALDLAFQKRGLLVASVVFGGEEPALSETGLFEVLHEAAAHCDGLTERAFFISYATDLLRAPTEAARLYMTRIAQGYFAYHALGYDAECTRFRTAALRETVWILDASVILPLLAQGALGNTSTAQLFQRLRDLEVPVFTTGSLFEEVSTHVQWALDAVARNAPGSSAFMMLALLRGYTKGNLFIDGYVNTAADRPGLTFEAYIAECLGTDHVPSDLEGAVETQLAKLGISTVDLKEWPGFRTVDWTDVPSWAEKIREDRQRRGTFRSFAQCRAEAEVLVILAGEREGHLGAVVEGSPSKAYFITQSGVLRRVWRNGRRPVWEPEALFRYVELFPTHEGWKPAVLHDCMTSSMFATGLEVINVEKYRRFFEPQIHEGTIHFKDLVQRYDSAEREFLRKHSRQFDVLDDLDKPLFSIQVAYEFAEREARRARTARASGGFSDKERIEYAQLKVERAHRDRQATHRRRQLEERRRQRVGEYRRKGK